MTNLTPQTLNVVGASGCVADLLTHSGGGSHPLFIWLHGGGGETGDHYRLWVNGGVMNRFATYLNGSSLSNFDIASLGVPQWLNSLPTSAGHLPTITHTATGVLWPAAVDACAAGILEAIANTSPSGVILGGFSWGTVLSMAAMLRVSLPIDGILCHYPIPDVRRIGGDLHTGCTSVPDVIYWDKIKGLGGSSTLADFNAVQTQIRKDASMLWYLEHGMTSNAHPVFLTAGELGDHVAGKSYGDPARSGSDVHDSKQYDDLAAALTVAGITHDGHKMTDPNGWESATEGDALNTQVEAWMVAAVA